MLTSGAMAPASSWLLPAGLVVSVWLAIALARNARLDGRAAHAACLWAIAGALVGGRLWAAAFAGAGWGDVNALSVLEGPKGALGAAFGAGVASAGYLFVTRRSVVAYADGMVPAAFVGYAVVRLGCLLDGCCFGTLTTLPWAVRYARGSGAYVHHLAAGWIQTDAAWSLGVHPLAAYHMAAGLLLATVTWRVRARAGQPLAWALAGYGAARVVLGLWRGGDEGVVFGLTADQLAGTVLVIAGACVARGTARAAFNHLRPALALGGAPGGER